MIIKTHPTIDDVKAALQVVMEAFRCFPFKTILDRSNLLAAILTAAVRSVLDTSPGFGMSSPMQASGKTLLAKCVSWLRTGEEPAIMPHQKGRDDEEVRKRLFSHALSGSGCLVWDNVLGLFDSAAAAAFMTAPVFSDRILGQSAIVSVPNTSMLILTGNNLTLAGDMPRRILPIYIDPGTETPFNREFSFDPASYCAAHRLKIIQAAVTIIRGYITMAKGRAPGCMGSFETWDRMVRQTVCWLGQEVQPGQWADPMDSVAEAVGKDPEREALGAVLTCWRNIFEGRPVTASDIVKKMAEFGDQKASDLREALSNLTGNPVSSSNSLGRVLAFRKGRIINGLVLEEGGQKDNVKLWRVNVCGS